MSAGDIHSNKAIGGNGGGIFTWGPMNILGGSIRLNEATGDGGGTNSSIMTVTGATISNNSSQTDGGGIFTDHLTISDSILDGNKAAGDGGAVYAFNVLDIQAGSIFTNNEAGGLGGAVIGNDTDIVDSQFIGNKAERGGAIHSFTSFVDISGHTIIDSNSATLDGGGIWVNNLTTLFVGTDVLFSNNSASVAYQIKPADIPLYQSNILTSTITVPFTYAYNNFDIGYIGDTILYVVTFESNGGTAIAPIAAAANETITAPTQPTRDGYQFNGWYKDSNLTQVWNFSIDTVTTNTTLYASWSKTNGNGSTTVQLPKTGSSLHLFVITLVGAGTLLIINKKFHSK